MEALHESQDAVRRMEEQRSRRQENRDRLEGEIAETADRLSQLDSLLTESDSDREARRALLAEKEAALAGARSGEERAHEEEASREDALEAHKSAVMEAMNRHAAAENHQTRLKAMLSTMDARLSELTLSCEPGEHFLWLPRVRAFYRSVGLMISYEKIPLVSMFFSIGFQVWMLINALFFAVYRKAPYAWAPLAVLAVYTAASAMVPLVLLRYFAALFFAAPLVWMLMLQAGGEENPEDKKPETETVL